MWGVRQLRCKESPTQYIYKYSIQYITRLSLYVTMKTVGDRERERMFNRKQQHNTTHRYGISHKVGIQHKNTSQLNTGIRRATAAYTPETQQSTAILATRKKRWMAAQQAGKWRSGVGGGAAAWCRVCGNTPVRQYSSKRLSFSCAKF